MPNNHDSTIDRRDTERWWCNVCGAVVESKVPFDGYNYCCPTCETSLTMRLDQVEFDVATKGKRRKG